MATLNNLASAKGNHYLHLNVRSLRNKHDQLLLELSNKNLDVITMSETWLREIDSSDHYVFPNYVLIRQDRSWIENGKVKKGGGICTYMKSSLNFTETKWSHLKLSSSDIEIQCIEIKYQHTKDVLILNTYRPPSGNKKKFIENIQKILDEITRRTNLDVILLGDMNIDIETGMFLWA